MTAISTGAAGRKGVLSAILAGGITAATCDFIAAMLIYGLSPERVGKAVARGWFGKAARDGGADVVAIGVASHYFILIVAAAIFVFASLRFPILRRMAWVTGPVFGICIYVVMHFVVLPLSAVHASGNPPGIQFVEEFLGHMFVIGLPIALWARKFLGTT
ncbi:MAG: hypothetical protein ABI655_02630 [Phenylobacterium sp.]